MSSDYVIKPLATASTVFLIETFVFNETDQTKALTFSAAAAIGTYGGMVIGSSLPDMSSTLPIYLGNGKGLLQRVAEVGFGGSASFVLNRYVLKNSSYRENIMNKIGTLIVADIVGEYVADYIAGRPLAILN